MKFILALAFLILGDLSVFSNAQDFMAGISLDEFLDQCSTTETIYSECNGKCHRSAKDHMECGFTSILNNSILLQARTFVVEQELNSLQEEYNRTLISTQNNFTEIDEILVSLAEDLHSLESSTASLDTVNQMNLSIFQLDANIMNANSTIESMMAVQLNHSEKIENMCSELTSQNETLDCLSQDILACESRMDEMNSTLNSCLPQIDTILEFQDNLTQSINEITSNMSCIEEAVEENTCAINNLTIVTEELIAKMMAFEDMNLVSMAELVQLQNETSETTDWSLVIHGLNVTVFDAIGEMAECQSQQELLIADVNCTLTECLDDMELQLNEAVQVTQNQSLMIEELESTVAEQQEINSNLSRRIDELELMQQACDGEISQQCSRIDELEAMMQRMEEMLMAMNDTQCQLIEKLEALQLQVDEQNCTFTECQEAMLAQQETMMGQMDEINCTVMMHHEKVCQLDDCLTSLMSSTGFECIPMEGTSPSFRTTPGIGMSTSEGGSMPTFRTTPDIGISTSEGGSSTTLSFGNLTTSRTPTNIENDGQLCERLDELDTKVDELLASIPDCPAGYVALYREEERIQPPLCVKFVLTSKDFCYHEHHCILQGLRLAEIEDNYTMCELSYYAENNPVLSNNSFFVGAKYQEVEQEWQWLCGSPVSEELVSASDLGDGSTECCASFNAATMKLESSDCTIECYALCMI